MGAQDHVTRPVNNAVSWIGSNIIEKEVNCLFSGHGSICLASGDGTEGYQKFVVDRSGIVDKRADNFLNAAFTVFVEELGGVCFWSELGLSSIGDWQTLVGERRGLSGQGCLNLMSKVSM
jgi:hypothetical protein